jgi:hypothetical protein
VLFASQLIEAVRTLADVVDDPPLRASFADFARHWAQLTGLRNVLLHPTSRDVNLSWLCALGDRLEYRQPGWDPEWVFRLDELHEPVEQLFAVVERYR